MYRNKTMVEVEEEKELLGKNCTKADEKKTKSTFNENAEIGVHTQTDFQTIIDSNTYNVNKVRTKTEPEDSDHETRETYNIFSITTDGLEETFDGNTYHLRETIVKAEADFVEGNYFQSVIEFEKRAFLDVQMSDYDSDESPTYIYDHCQESFTSKRNVARHINESHKIQKYTKKHLDLNTLSNEIVAKDNSKKKGQLTKRVHTDEKRYKCAVCPWGFSVKSNLVRHIRMHTGEKPYKCDVCLKSFSQSNILKSHKVIHTGENLYKCDMCEKIFNRKTYLKRHERCMHTVEKPYECDVCHKSFSQSYSLKTHKLRVHTGGNFYKCDLCEKKYTQKTHLKRHVRCVHTVEKPYKCAVCDKSFSCSSDLTKHNRMQTQTKGFPGKKKPYAS